MAIKRKLFRVSLWDHTWLHIDVCAANEAEALHLAQCQYAAAESASCPGFDVADNHSDDWEVRAAPKPGNRRRP